MKDIKALKKKPHFQISPLLRAYLEKYKRITTTSVSYEDLMRFSGYINLEDEHGNDTLWLRVYYPEFEYEEIKASLIRAYTFLHSDGGLDSIAYLTIDSIDYCSFGNSKPFRIRVRNVLNDNFTNLYIKKADASRIYGLEVEEMLSPYTMNYLVYEDTLIEEHILGIPGDIFIADYLPKCTELEKSQIAKEFVKFNEKCFIGLLGDMRSYNYVVIPTHDFDQVNYKIRAIDFDQEAYEGNYKFYLPQFYKENFVMVDMVLKKLKQNSIEQYRKEIRSVLVRRTTSNKERVENLVKVMRQDRISTPNRVDELKMGLFKITKDIKFKTCQSMGDILQIVLDFVIRNYKSPL
ncbi:hypothetical protein ACYSNX_08685 [Myroides sp. LJL115]